MLRESQDMRGGDMRGLSELSALDPRRASATALATRRASAPPRAAPRRDRVLLGKVNFCYNFKLFFTSHKSHPKVL